MSPLRVIAACQRRRPPRGSRRNAAGSRDRRRIVDLGTTKHGFLIPRRGSSCLVRACSTRNHQLLYVTGTRGCANTGCVSPALGNGTCKKHRELTKYREGAQFHRCCQWRYDVVLRVALSQMTEPSKLAIDRSDSRSASMGSAPQKVRTHMSWCVILKLL